MARANGRRNLGVLDEALRAASERERRVAEPAREAVPPARAGRRAPRAQVQRRRQRLRGRLLLARAVRRDRRPSPRAAAVTGRRPDPRRRAAGRGLRRPALQRGGPQRAARAGPSGGRGAAACRRRCAVGRRPARSPWGP